MPPDMLALVHNAIENKKTRIWLCPKGHPYLIGECGRPTVVSKCHCGEVIGGIKHNPVANVKAVDEAGKYTAKSPKGYVLTESDAKTTESFRAMKPFTVRAMRLLLHLTLLLHHASTGGASPDLAKLLSAVKPTEIGAFLWSQIRADLAVLCSITASNTEDVAILMHFLVRDLSHSVLAQTDEAYAVEKEVDRDTFEQQLAAFIDSKAAEHRKNEVIFRFRAEHQNAAHLRLLMAEILEQKKFEIQSQ